MCMKNKIDKYFHGGLSPEEEAEMQQLLCSEEVSDELDSAMRDLFDECCSESRPHRVIARLVPYIISAAAVLALFIFIPRAHDKGITEGEKLISAIEWVEESVPQGQNRVVELSDGTILHLNAGSRLTYPKKFFGDARNIFMSGEAFLQVAKDPEHPFVVKSGEVKVTVLGTSFNFKDFPDSRNVEILLMEGSVKVDIDTPEGPHELRLSPGDKMRYNRVEGKVDITNFKPDKYKTFYEDNSLHFFDVEMSDIARELSRRFDQEIVVMDDKLASRRYFAIFTNNESLDDVLNAMNADGRISIRRSKGIIYLQSK